MIWQAPWAWLGLATLVIPIAVHLLARRQAPRVKFPTLRFLVKTESMANRRHRLTDLTLLAVRAAAIAAGVTALAQPYLVLRSRTAGSPSLRSRAIVIDASASMSRMAGAATALATARARAAALQPAASSTTTVESANLRSALEQASAWLAAAPGQHEIVVLSDFQLGAIDIADVQALPSATGVRFDKIELPAEAHVDGPFADVNGRRLVPQVDVAERAIDVRWTVMSEPTRGSAPLKILNGPTEQRARDAAMAAVAAIGVPAAGSDHAVVIVLPEAAERASLVARAHPIDAPWMFDVVSALHEIEGVPRPAAASALLDGKATLLVFPVSAEPVALAGLVAASLHAAAGATPLSELEPLSVSAKTLRGWERPPGAASVVATSGASDGRWCWAAGLALLGLETWMRRRRKVPTAAEAVSA